MGKRWRKAKAGQQRSKKPRKPRRSESEGSAAAHGTFSGLRRGTRGLFRGGKRGPKTTAGKIVDAALWLAVAIAAGALVFGQCGR